MPIAPAKFTPWRKSLHVALFAIVVGSWSVALFNSASDKGWQPFKAIVHRARVHRHYRDNAPDKLESVGDLMSKNVGQEDRLLKRLASKYSSPVPDLDVISLGVAAFDHAQERALKALPPSTASSLSFAWEQWNLLPLQQRLLVVTAQSVALSTGCFGAFPSFLTLASPDEYAPAFIATWLTLGAAVLRPLPSFADLAASKVVPAVTQWWSSLEAPNEQLGLIAAAAVAAVAVRPRGHRRSVVLGWVLASLWVSNPGAGAGGGGESAASFQQAALASLVSKEVTPATLARSFPPGSLAVTDLGVISLLTYTKTKTEHHWLSPVIAVGVGGQWSAGVEMKPMPNGQGIKMAGRPAPAWIIPAAFAGVGWAVSHIPF